MKRSILNLMILLFMIVFFHNGLAQTLLQDRFGVTLRLQEPYNDGVTQGLYYAFDWNSFVPTKNVATVDWTESDWYGNWTLNDMSYTHIDHPPAPGTPDNDWYPSGAEYYDVEAIYFDNDADSFYIAIVTSVPHYKDYGGGVSGVGIYESSRVAGWGIDPVWIRPGDISINLFEGTARAERNSTQWHYNYGVNIVHENRDDIEWVSPPGFYSSTTMRDNTVGTEFYRTTYDGGGSNNEDPANSDWYTSAPGLNVEAYWEHTNFDPLSTVSQNLGFAQLLGNARTSYYLYTFPAFGSHPAGELENNADTWIIEASIPRSLLGASNPGNGDQVGLQFLPGCRNDGDSNVANVELIADFDDRWDYGDAPDPSYPTLLASSGARHFITEGFYLGQGVDEDSDGQGNAAVTGDDADGNDDEDGVTFTSPLMQFDQNTIDVEASTSGYLNAWMDFNQDGDWADPGEQIFSDEPLTAGTNSVTFTVPLITDQGSIRTTGIVARFRFSSQQGLSYTGDAPDGEVEDYLVDVLVPVELAHFSSTYTGDAVELHWETKSESDNLGFNIYRADGEGEFDRINETIIPGAGSSASARHYSFKDYNVTLGQTYRYQLEAVNHNGHATVHEALTVTVENPSEYRLDQNYPNPFNPVTQIVFTLKEEGHVQLDVYNTTGQLIKTLMNEHNSSGSHMVVWDGRDNNNMAVPSGTYLYTLKVNDFVQTRKMILVK